MSRSASDAYAVLGVTPEISDDDLRRVYRALVKRHHPDHNGGSPESAARFARIQDAYSTVTQVRQGGTVAGSGPRRAPEPGPRRGPRPAPRPAGFEPGIEQRIADLERELAERRASEREPTPGRPAGGAAASDAFRQPAKPRLTPRPTPEELGHYETDDSLASIIDDAAAEFAERLKDVRRSDLSRRLADLLGGRSEDE
jgi:curved DNA-binding protein CbpA